MKSSVNDVVLTVISHKHSGDVVKNITMKGLLTGFLWVIGMILLIGPGQDAIVSYAKQHDLDTRRHQMEVLANNGQDTAAIWLVKHYFNDNKYRLPDLVKKGHPEAMYYQGIHDIYFNKDKDRDSGTSLIRQAAAQGLIPAIEYVERNNI